MTKEYTRDEASEIARYISLYGELVDYSTMLENDLARYKAFHERIMPSVISAEVKVLRVKRADFEKFVPEVIRNSMSFRKSPQELDRLVESALAEIGKK